MRFSFAITGLFLLTLIYLVMISYLLYRLNDLEIYLLSIADCLFKKTNVEQSKYAD